MWSTLRRRIGEKELDWFIIIKFVPQMPKRIKCIGHIYPVATGSSPGKVGGGNAGVKAV